MTAREKCPNDRPGIPLRCHAGYLWELCGSECSPPDQRQNTGHRCPLCLEKGLTGTRPTLLIIDEASEPTDEQWEELRKDDVDESGGAEDKS